VGGLERLADKSRMRLAIVIALTTGIDAAACLARTKDPAAQQWYRVNVRMSSKTGAPILGESQAVATAVLATISVRLTWRGLATSNGAVACGNESTVRDIEVEVLPHAPANRNDGALAIAMPNLDTGVRVVIFYDSVARLRDQAPMAKILGYLLAHEIAHVLQGIAHHSRGGVMSARWTENDFKQMSGGILTFTPEDTRLIRRGFIQSPRASCTE
jgi:hypothetical protein